MRARKAQNMARAINNSNENWMLECLEKTGHRWTRQAQRGFRLFDFWSHELGIAIEVDGPEHRADYDSYRDEYNYRRSGVVVIRVRNKNEEDAARALKIIGLSGTWDARKAAIWGPTKTKRCRRRLSDMDDEKRFLDEYVNSLLAPLNPGINPE